jgi:hypothetical protein
MINDEERGEAGLGGIGIGVVAAEIAHAAAKPPAFQIVEYEITDPVGFKEYIKGADAIHSARIFLARHAQGTALAGEPPKKWIGDAVSDRFWPGSSQSTLTFELIGHYAKLRCKG